MIYEKAMQLVKALEGRGYRQAHGALKTGPRTHCCLGVACQIAGVKPVLTDKIWRYREESLSLPLSVLNEFDFYTALGNRRDGGKIIIDGKGYNSLADANDGIISDVEATKSRKKQVPFKKIAKYIRENYWAL